MWRGIDEYFSECKIEYYGALAYSDCRETGREMIEREGFVPRSVIIYAVPYYAGETENISRYAASLDYHIILRSIGERLIEKLRGHFGDIRAVSYGDHSPIDECSAAASLGIGVIGDNTLLINERYGSYVFIGDVVTDVDPGLLGVSAPQPIGSCLHCGLCKLNCPTGILGGKCDRCLSAITQRKGELDEREAELMRRYNTAWGCDECQKICPMNADPVITPIGFFKEQRITSLDRQTVEAMSKAEFKSRAFGWRGRAVVLRNLDVLGK